MRTKSYSAAPARGKMVRGHRLDGNGGGAWAASTGGYSDEAEMRRVLDDGL